MSSTNSTNLRIELIGTGDQSGTWGTTTNNNFAYVIDSAIAGYQTVSVSSANQALTYLTTPNSTPSLNQSVYAMLRLTTSTTANFAVYAPPNSKSYIIWNNSGYTATIYNSTILGNTTAAGTGISIPNGVKYFVFSDGTNFYTLDSTSPTGVTSFSAGTTGLTPNTATTGAVTLSGTLAIGNGGTGQSTQQAAMTALAGAATSGQYLRGNGTNVLMSAIQAADVPTLNQNTTGSAGSVANSVTFNSSGGAAAGSTYNGSAARIVDYSTVGAPSATGTGASGTWGINISGNAATATNATNLATANFSVVQSGSKLYFKYGSTNIASLDSSGNFVALANVTAYGTP